MKFLNKKTIVTVKLSFLYYLPFIYGVNTLLLIYGSFTFCMQHILSNMINFYLSNFSNFLNFNDGAKNPFMQFNHMPFFKHKYCLNEKNFNPFDCMMNHFTESHCNSYDKSSSEQSKKCPYLNALNKQFEMLQNYLALYSKFSTDCYNQHFYSGDVLKNMMNMGVNFCDPMNFSNYAKNQTNNDCVNNKGEDKCHENACHKHHIQIDNIISSIKMHEDNIHQLFKAIYLMLESYKG